jgi:hypothetical protein
MICSAFAIHESATTMRPCDVILGTTSGQYFVHPTTRSNSAMAARITVALGLGAGDTQWRVVGMRIYGRIRLRASASASTANWAAWVEA